MDRTELAWRARAAARTAAQRVRSSMRPPVWDRDDLIAHLAPLAELDGARTALREHRWQDAHDALSAHFASRPQRFAIAPALLSTVRQRVRRAFPDSAADAVARADRVLAGQYDLLGYRGLRFVSDRCAGPTPRTQREDLSNLSGHADQDCCAGPTRRSQTNDQDSCEYEEPLTDRQRSSAYDQSFREYPNGLRESQPPEEFPPCPRCQASGASTGATQEFPLCPSCPLCRASAASIDWHLDPVHDRRTPQRFFADVPYLDPACGDHKIIWELNRHQHWLVLGRAFWLTGDNRYRDRCVTELASWLEANPPLIGVNWSSMLELGFRSLSWIWALHLFADASAADRSPWTVDLLLGLDRQLAHVEQNLSYYFSPNTHLLGEGLALYVGGRSLPELAASARRETIGRRILTAESDRQIGADGGHCERSTHYHRYALDFYLLALVVARITNDPAAPQFEQAVARLADAARLLADDSGRAPHLGDDDGGLLLPLAGRAADDWRDSLAAAGALLVRPELSVGRTPEEPFWLLAHPALAAALDRSRATPAVAHVASAALADTGYYVSRSAGDHLVVDGGAHGYRNGGHAHADALSLTFSSGGRPLLIDPGTACYTIDNGLRDRMRSTALHNTLVVDDRDQSIPMGPFHWSHTADAIVRRWRSNPSFDYFDAAHDGYRPLEHRRHVLALHADLLVVADLVSGDGPHTAAAHWHVDPRWHVDATPRGAVMAVDGRRISLHAPAGLVECFTADEGTGLGWHSPVYGRVEPATTVRITQRGPAPVWIVSVFGLDGDNPVRDVETVPVWAEAGALRHSIAVRVIRERSTDYVAIAEPAAAAAAWRVAEFETDAGMLFCRVAADHEVTRVALVDGSTVRSSVRRHVQLSLPAAVPDLHVDMRDGAQARGPVESELGIRN
jgi:heparinase II/III-like protein